MEEFTTINQLITETVKNSSYVTALISSGVFIIYTIITKLISYFKDKDKNKPMLEMTKVIKALGENISTLNQALQKTLVDAEIKENNKISNVINSSFEGFKSKILSKCIEIIVFNNIDSNKELVRTNVYKTINTEYYKVYSTLSDYEINSINVSSKLQEEWIEQTTEDCYNIIYNGQTSAERIRQISSRLEQNIDGYSIFVKNKILNH